MKNIKIGAQMYSLRSLIQTLEGLNEAIGTLRNMGYRTIQLCGQSKSISVFDISEILKNNGVECVSTHNSLSDLINNLPEVIKTNRLWGSNYIGIGGMPEEYRKDAKGFVEFTKIVNKLAHDIKQEGMFTVYHNHAFEFNRFDGVLGMDILFDNFTDDVQFELDTYWAQAGGCDPVFWCYKLDGRMDIIHFKDMKGSDNFETVQIMVPVGCGNLNWEKIKTACEETSVRYAEVEQDNASDNDDPYGQMEQSVRYLRSKGYAI